MYKVGNRLYTDKLKYDRLRTLSLLNIQLDKRSKIKNPIDFYYIEGDERPIIKIEIPSEEEWEKYDEMVKKNNL